MIKLNEMANYYFEDTGLPMPIYISDKRGVNHGARIKVSCLYSKTSNKQFSITISDNPEVVANHDVGNIKSSDIKKAIEFVKLNKDILLQYWNLAISTGTLVKNMKKVD